MRLWLIFILISWNFSAYAQFLPDNKTLNHQSLNRWMQSAAEMAFAVELIDSMHVTEEELIKFDALSATEQDQKIQEFLLRNRQWHIANTTAKKFGWQSPGEFRRFSTKLGNAIAAYFSKKDQEGLTPDQIKQLHQKTDPAILAVPETDIQFVQQHEKELQRYIQRYGK